MLTTHVIGNLVANPVARTIQTESGEIRVANFRVAVNSYYGGKQTTDYVDCVAWRALAEVVEKHLAKGRKVALTGKPRARHSVGKDGTIYDSLQISVSELEFLDRKPSSSEEEIPPFIPDEE